MCKSDFCKGSAGLGIRVCGFRRFQTCDKGFKVKGLS